MWAETRTNLERSGINASALRFRRKTLNKLERLLFGTEEFTYAQYAEFVVHMIKGENRNRGYMQRVLMDVSTLTPLSDGVPKMVVAILRRNHEQITIDQFKRYLSFINSPFHATAACLLIVGFKEFPTEITALRVGDYNRATRVLADKKIPAWAGEQVAYLTDKIIEEGGDNNSLLFRPIGKFRHRKATQRTMNLNTLHRKMRQAQVRSGIKAYDYYRGTRGEFIPGGLISYADRRSK